MENCKELQIVLTDFMDGQLPEKERTRILEHILECEVCQKAYKKIQAFEKKIKTNQEGKKEEEFLQAVAGKKVILKKHVTQKATKGSEIISSCESIEKNASSRGKKSDSSAGLVVMEDVTMEAENGSKIYDSTGSISINDSPLFSVIATLAGIVIVSLVLDYFFFSFFFSGKKDSQNFSRQMASKIERDTEMAMTLCHKGDYELAIACVDRLINYLQESIAQHGTSEIETKLQEARQLKAIILKDWEKKK